MTKAQTAAERYAQMAEARRVLRPDATLVIYSNGFYGRMTENPEFARWNRESYLTQGTFIFGGEIWFLQPSPHYPLGVSSRQ